MAKCPGQDKYFWTSDDVFDLDCPACGEPIEFFKTDPMRRCPACNYASPNPRLDAGCAQWCPHAELCTGIKMVANAEGDSAEAGTVRLIDRLLVAARDNLGRDRQRTVRTLEALEQAQKLLALTPQPPLPMRRSASPGEGESRSHGGEGPTPRVVLAAVVLHDVAPEAARHILQDAEVDEDTIAQVVGILQTGAPDTAEGALVAEAWQRLGAAEPVAAAGEG